MQCTTNFIFRICLVNFFQKVSSCTTCIQKYTIRILFSCLEFTSNLTLCATVKHIRPTSIVAISATLSRLDFTRVVVLEEKSSAILSKCRWSLTMALNIGYLFYGSFRVFLWSYKENLKIPDDFLVFSFVKEGILASRHDMLL